MASTLMCIILKSLIRPTLLGKRATQSIIQIKPSFGICGREATEEKWKLMLWMNKLRT